MSKVIKATKRQKEVLEFIYISLETNGFAPTLEDFNQKFGFKSNQAAIDHLYALEKKGLIKKEDRSARSLQITNLGFKTINKPVIIPSLGISFAGALTQSETIAGEWKEISKDVSRLDNEVFIIKVSGDSMLNAGINDGDHLLVKKEKEFKSGDIVLARNGDDTTVKRFISQDAPPYLFLKPENPKYKLIYFTEKITLIGVIIGKFISGQIQQIIQGRFL